ncbi:MAG: class I SAM-dependent methyltransferase [Anaerolineae bacterium]|nr:class I SAM-dependent methyltransferase [Anaerolineae bacterium]
MPNHHLTEARSRAITLKIIRAYDNWVIRTYSYIRFLIMNMRILEEIEQYLPTSGQILDVGCGFGLFSFFFALSADKRNMLGVDINTRRIATACGVRAKFGLDERICFESSDVGDYRFDEPVDAIVVLDLLHHVPEKAAQRLVARFAEILPAGGLLLVKDITARPWLKMAFTWLLDKLMDFRGPLRYYHKDEMITLLAAQGFEVRVHRMIDILPYPHVLYVCRKLDD